MRNKQNRGKPLKCLVFALSFLFFMISAAFSQRQPEILTLIDQGVEYELESKFDQAIETYRKVLDLDSANSFAKIHLAKLLSWQNKFDEALNILNEVIAEDPDQLEALFRKAQILSWQGKYIESIDTYKAYLAYKRNDPLGLMGIARVLFWSGSYQDAIDYFNQAIEAGADEAEARIELGKVYLGINDKQRAREEFNEALKIDPGNDEAKRFLEGIPTLRKFELSPLGLTLYIYPDKSVGAKFTSFIIYHHKQSWDLGFQFEDQVVNRVHDQTISSTYVYRGIQGLYLLGSLSFAPGADFSPGFGGDVAANYSFKNGFGVGIALSADVYGRAPLSLIQNDTLYAIKPEITKYFSDLGSITLRYNQYVYKTGFVTETVNLGLAFEYYKHNLISAGVTYGGDIETRKSDRKVFEFGLGISYNFTEKLKLSLNYNRIETQYGKTNQISLEPLIQW